MSEERPRRVGEKTLASWIALATMAALAPGLLAARGGCGPGGGAPIPPQTNACAATMAPPPDGAAHVTLGRDVNGPLQPIVNGDTLPLSFGPQGGEHVFVTVQLYAPTATTWRYTLTFVDESSFTAGSTTVAVDACAGWNLTQKIRVVMSDAKPHTGPLSIVATPGADAVDAGTALRQTVTVTVKAP